MWLCHMSLQNVYSCEASLGARTIGNGAEELRMLRVMGCHMPFQVSRTYECSPAVLASMSSARILLLTLIALGEGFERFVACSTGIFIW